MDTTANPPVKFDLSFTPKLEEYSKTEKPTVKGFAKLIGCDVFDLWAWANKKKKNEKGELTDDLARPKFHDALVALEKIEKDAKEEERPKLNPKQEMFCQLYARSRELFGNATQCYIVAYGLNKEDSTDYRNANVSASQLLVVPSIAERISELLQAVTDEMIDEELAYVALQRYELPSKVAAIREFNKVKGRIIEKIDHTTKGDKITPILGGSANVPSNDSNA